MPYSDPAVSFLMLFTVCSNMEALLKHLGNPGRYHLLIATLFAITWWSVSLGNVSMTFYGFTPNYTCDAEKMLSEGGAGSLRNRGYWYLNDTNDPCEFTITNGNTSESLACSQWNFETRNGKDASIVTDVSSFNICLTKPLTSPPHHISACDGQETP